MVSECEAKKLCEVGIVPITTHDSLVVEREHEQEALKIISNVFKEAYGVVLSFMKKLFKTLLEALKEVKSLAPL